MIGDLNTSCRIDFTEKYLSLAGIMKSSHLYFWIPFTVVLFSFLSYKNLEWKLAKTKAWTDGTLDSNHERLLDFDYYYNEQSRLFQFLFPELIHQMTGIPVRDAYKFQRLLFFGLAYVVLFWFSSKWLYKIWALAVVIYFSLITMPQVYLNHLQESAPLLSFSFFICTYLILIKRDKLYSLILCMGAINNETMLFLPALYFFYNYEKFDPKHIKLLAFNTVKYAIPAFLIVLVIRWYNIDRPHLGGAYHLEHNLHHLIPLLKIYGICWFLPIVVFFKLPLFFKRAYLSIPFFIVPHLITGKIEETRQMLPLAILILPAAMISILILVRLVIPLRFHSSEWFALIEIKSVKSAPLG